MKKSLLFIMGLFLTFSVSVSANSIDEVKYKAAKAISILKADGYHIKSAKAGYLNEKGYKTFSITLYKGNTYQFIGVGDSNVKDLDVKIYDENWHLVEKDTDSSSVSIAMITPKWTGTFYVKTKIYRGHGYWVQLSAWK